LLAQPATGTLQHHHRWVIVKFGHSLRGDLLRLDNINTFGPTRINLQHALQTQAHLHHGQFGRTEFSTTDTRHDQWPQHTHLHPSFGWRHYGRRSSICTPKCWRYCCSDNSPSQHGERSPSCGTTHNCHSAYCTASSILPISPQLSLLHLPASSKSFSPRLFLLSSRYMFRPKNIC
jgi:hypothetical protein